MVETGDKKEVTTEIVDPVTARLKELGVDD